MKKCRFYSFMFRYGKSCAVSHSGWTDGVFYYYFNHGSELWHAVHPQTGLGVAYGETRKEAMEKATAAHVMGQIEKAMQQRGPGMIEAFEKAVQDAESI